jgi:hypothetical protein
MLVYNKQQYKILVGKPMSKIPLRGPSTDRIILKINLTKISRVIMDWENYPNEMQTKTALCRQNAQYFTFQCETYNFVYSEHERTDSNTASKKRRNKMCSTGRAKSK